MIEINESILISVTAVITGISALFCVISLATTNWSNSNGLFCTTCSKSAAGLSIVGFICLVIAVIVLILFIAQILRRIMRLSALPILFLASIFTSSAYAVYFEQITGYSYRLMVVAHVFSYIASLMTAFWIGGFYGTTVIRANQS